VVGLLGVLVAALAVLGLCRAASRAVLERADRGPGGATRPDRPDARPRLPAADRPPRGLAPLVPSPRRVEEEVARGLRELQLWLASPER
jgi:hypothetical protein